MTGATGAIGLEILGQLKSLDRLQGFTHSAGRMTVIDDLGGAA